MKTKSYLSLALCLVLICCLTACGIGGQKDIAGNPFPTFTGTDLEGNSVDSSLFQNHSVTVVNFWFSTCHACVEELEALNKLNESLKEKGGAVIGVNTDTFGGKEEAIAEAKNILETKGASYTNVSVSTDSDLAAFTKNFFGYPITYVVDRNGNIVDKPIMGGIENASAMKAVQKQIDKAIGQDS